MSRNWYNAVARGQARPVSYAVGPSLAFLSVRGDTLPADRVGTNNGGALAGKCVEDKEQINEQISPFFPSLLLPFIYSLTVTHFQDPLTEYPHQ